MMKVFIRTSDNTELGIDIVNERQKSPDSSVGMALGYGLDNRSSRV
jgi:hypothetical protein